MMQHTKWWQHGAIYQIYPRSFQDSNNDGVGDLPGIIHRLDYLAWLGVNAIWISPIYPSPMADFGYDISDYCNIDPVFGTLGDMDRLISEAHRRNIKVILDYVPGHTSNQHPWFRESRSSRDNPKRDWYIWRDPAPNGAPPNNWLSHFDGKSAWAWDEATEQYYLHVFLPEQPDLNWRNSELQEAMFGVLRFWLERGIDGFRVDVAHRIIKDAQFRDNPLNPDWQPGMNPFMALKEAYTRNQPELHPIFARMRALLDEYDERMMVGEINTPVAELMNYYGSGESPEFHLPFNFQLIHSRWDAPTVSRIVEQYEGLLPDNAWPNWVLGNHDQHRFASRAGAEQARAGMMFLFTMRGTPTLYYGDEIGMRDGVIPPELVQDPWEKNVPGLGLGRDPERTPMQWDGNVNGGFCSSGATPWLPVNSDYSARNVAEQRQKAGSMLSLTRSLIALRQSEPVLITGRYQTVEANDKVFAFSRTDAEKTLIIALNFSSDSHVMDMASPRAAKVRLSTYMDRVGEPQGNTVQLRANEGLILELQ
jgi:alpha-glucosidase